MTFVRPRQSLAAVSGTEPTASCALFHVVYVVAGFAVSCDCFTTSLDDISDHSRVLLMCTASEHAVPLPLTEWPFDSANCHQLSVTGCARLSRLLRGCATNLERSANDVISARSHCYPLLETLLSAILSWHFVPTTSRFLCYNCVRDFETVFPI